MIELASVLAGVFCLTSCTLGWFLFRQTKMNRKDKDERSQVLSHAIEELEIRKNVVESAEVPKKSLEARRQSAIECLLFVSYDPLTPARAAEALGIQEKKAGELLFGLSEEFRLRGKGLAVEEVAGGYRMVTHGDHARVVSDFLRVEVKRRMSRASLEVLAIIAYHQPASRPQIEGIRGVASEAGVALLLEKGLIRTMGRSSGAGRPVMFGTAPSFLKTFGLNTLEDLPALPKSQEPEGPFSPDLYAEIERRLDKRNKEKQGVAGPEDPLEAGPTAS